MPRVSVVLPTYNRLKQLQRVLACLEQQTYPIDDFEVIVVSDGSTDGTEGYLESYHTPLKIIPLFQKNQGPAAARNRGVEAARGEIILFIDDDVCPVPRFVEQHVQTHQQNGVAVVVLGPMLTPPDFVLAPWVHWEQTMLYKQYDDIESGEWEPTARQFYTGNASVCREHIVKAGGFDISLMRAEDVDLAYRMAANGVKFVFNPNAIGYHYAERNFNSWMRTPYLYGRYDVVFARDKGHSWLLHNIAEEFHERHPLVQMLAQFCISRRVLYGMAIGAMRQIASVSHRMQMPNVTQYAYSGIFNLCHYQGIADELGDRQQFLNLMRQQK